MIGNKIRMANPLSEGVIEYTDGTKASQEQMAKDVVSFLTWAAEPHLEIRKELGFKSVIYLLILTILVYLIKKKIWLRIEPKV
jgi:ubiquinol-cytochrome c reductase cytochrome c1 subunit